MNLRTSATAARTISASAPAKDARQPCLFTQLDLRDRVQAVVLAYECGLVRPGDA